MSEVKQISVLMVRPDEYPFRLRIDCTEARMEELLKGPLEVLRLNDNALLVRNAHAQLNRLPQNRALLQESTYDEFLDDPANKKQLKMIFGPLDAVIYGDFLIAYAGPDCDEFRDLPEDLEEKYERRFHFPDRFFNIKTGIFMKHFVPEVRQREDDLER